MYQHHKESLRIMEQYFSKKKDVIALIFGGSVAKGCERIDSDLDAMVIVSESDYKKKCEQNKTAETIDGLCTYEGGYFDVKYMTKQYLREAAEKGSEPTRNSFMKAKVLFTKDEEIRSLIEKIPVFQENETEEKMRSFYADFWVNYYYFLKSCPIDGYMKVHVVNEIIYSVYRMILQDHQILFPSNRRLEEFVEQISEETKQIVIVGKEFADTKMVDKADKFVELFFQHVTYPFSKDISEVLSRYTKDFEQWWREQRPNINEW